MTKTNLSDMAVARFTPAHEERIQKLEENLSEVKAAHAEMAANLRNLGTQVQDGVGRINDKIDTIIAPLSKSLQDHIKEDEELAAKVTRLENTVTRLEEEREASRSKMKSLRGALIAIITGAGAIALKEAAVWLLK